MGTKKTTSSIGIGFEVGVDLETHVVDSTASQVHGKTADQYWHERRGGAQGIE